MASLRWTSKDLELLPDDGKRYEIVDGELFVNNVLQSPNLPGFSCPVGQIFTDIL